MTAREKILVSAVRVARQEFDRISYQKKADAGVLKVLDTALEMYDEHWQHEQDTEPERKPK